MVKVIFLSNPFDTDKKTILEAPYVACQIVQGYIKPFIDNYPDTDFHISINGHVIEETEIITLCPAISDNIVIIPVVGKGALRSIANIALMAFVSTFSFGTGVSAFWTGVAKAGMMYVGGRIINAILPPPKMPGAESQNNSPTYGWSGAKPIAATGTPIGRTFGTVKPAPVVLARHVTIEGDKQYLNILYGGGEGPIDSLDNITIDGNPISNYKEVQLDVRLGTNEQEPIPNFGDTFADQAVNYELVLSPTDKWVPNINYKIDSKLINGDDIYKCVTAGISGSAQPIWSTNNNIIDGTVGWSYHGNIWATHQTEGNAGEGLEVTIELPYGLYHSNDNGGLDSASVTIQIQYKKVDSADWLNIANGVLTNKTEDSNSWGGLDGILANNIHGISGDALVIKNGHLSILSVVSSALTETWTISYAETFVMEDPAWWWADAPKIKRITSRYFTVIGSISGAKANANISETYNNGIISFNIQEYKDKTHEGFVVGDAFSLIVTPNLDFVISAAKNTAVRRVFKVGNLEPAKYEVRCKCKAKSGTDTRSVTRVYWSQLSHVIYNDFARPGKVLVGIKALATDQLSGSDPDVGWTQTRSNANVWNPNTAMYEQKPLTNPYWACYDMIHNCKYLKNINTGQYEYVVEGNPVSRIDYPALAENAAYSAELDSAGDPRFELNIYIDTNISFWDALARLAVVGRGVIIPKGTKYSCICDKPAIPTQLFTMGNITEKSLKGKFQSTKDRSQSIEVEFFNKQKDYKQDLAVYYGDDWDNTTRVPNPTKVTRYGITKYKYAYREAVFLFKGNKYLKRIEIWESDIDAIACKPGDVVLLQHDVPKWGLAGGRIISATANTVTLDKEVVLEPGKTYAVEIRLLNDSRVNRLVQYAEGNVLMLTAPFTDIPDKYDVYAFGESNKVTKPFKIINIVKSKDLRCKLTGIEYIEDMYSDIVDIPIINYSAFDNTLFEVEKLSIGQETYTQKDGVIVSVIHCSWAVPRGRNVKEILIFYSDDGGMNWQNGGKTTDNFNTILGLKSLKNYLVKICTVNELGIISPGIVSEQIYITGKDQPPSDVPKLTAIIDQTDSTKIQLSWPAVTDVDLRGYRVMEGNKILTLTPITDTRYIYTATSSRQYSFSVVAIDNSGNPSNIPAVKTINIITEPATCAGFSAVIQETDRSRLKLSWIANPEQDISYYEIRLGEDWEHSTLIATQLKANNYTHALTTEGSQNFMIKAVNVAGHASQQPTSKRLQIILRPDAVINVQAVQEPRDRSMVKVTWNASPGKDIAGYELRYGNDWVSGIPINTVKESTYWWYIPSSGTYNIMVQARTVAGYVSNISNTSITAMIEAYDVTGFSAVQLMTDRTKVRLSWDQPLSLDVAYFEIRKGATWDTAIVVGRRVSGTYYDVIVTEEISQTFWIKSVTIAGKYSLNPAKVEGIFNMNPDPVTNIQISQNMNDKSVVTITWIGISESDLTGYQVKIGYVWETAEALPLTQELKTTYSPSATGDLKVMIKSVNAAGYYSDEASANLYITLEPAMVTGLQVLQNGEYNELYWDKHPEPDVVAYEIREGASFDLGALIASGVTLNSYTVKVDVERNYRYHVKAINRANKCSINAVSQSLFVENLPPKNVIVTYDDITLQEGTLDNVEFGISLINWSNIGGKWPAYPTTKFSDVGGRNVLKLKKVGSVYPMSGIYTCRTIDIGQIITANISIQFVSSVILRGTGSAVLQTRTSRNGIDWTTWQDFRPAQYTFRYLDRRVLLGTTDTAKTPEVNQMATSIDVDDVEAVGSVLIPVGGSNISYGKNFYTIPVLTPMAMGDNRFPQVLTKTVAEFTVKVVDRAGNDVGGQLDWRAKGY